MLCLQSHVNIRRLDTSMYNEKKHIWSSVTWRVPRVRVHFFGVIWIRISDLHSDHETAKKPMNSWTVRLHRFLWCTLMYHDHAPSDYCRALWIFQLIHHVFWLRFDYGNLGSKQKLGRAAKLLIDGIEKC